jgi:hypothetical protein
VKRPHIARSVRQRKRKPKRRRPCHRHAGSSRAACVSVHGSRDAVVHCSTGRLPEPKRTIATSCERLVNSAPRVALTLAAHPPDSFQWYLRRSMSWPVCLLEGLSQALAGLVSDRSLSRDFRTRENQLPSTQQENRASDQIPQSRCRDGPRSRVEILVCRISRFGCSR